ncbi:MAG: D-alanine--D-alanine ligase [Alphaproteobacteria bacterium]|nr:D-alanine--D-alanine ligase [Alphaproteobacteria bacterium]
MIHVAVVKGGLSSEREVSLVSGTGIANALRELNYNVSEIDMGRDVAVQLANLKPDVVFNALHGTYGEDGCLPGLLNIMNIPYTHSGVQASAIAMDKLLTKRICEPLGIPFPAHEIRTKEDILNNNFMDVPCVIKPTNEGSSNGVFVLLEKSQRQLTKQQLDLSDTYMVEPYIPGIELTSAILGDEALGVMEIQPNLGFYNFESKYAPGGSDHIFPARIVPEDLESIKELTLLMHRTLGCRGVSRADIRYDNTGSKGKFYFLELNTHPGMTPTSLVPDIAKHCKMSYHAIVDRLVKEARCD